MTIKDERYNYQKKKNITIKKGDIDNNSLIQLSFFLNTSSNNYIQYLRL